MLDILTLLRDDHKQIKQTLVRLTAEHPPKQARQLFEGLYVLLTVHAEFEETAVYPLLLKHSASKPLALEGYEEHRQAIILLDSIESREDDPATTLAKIHFLNDGISHHIKQEEGLFFPRLRRLVGAAERQRLGAAYHALRERAHDKLLALKEHVRTP